MGTPEYLFELMIDTVTDDLRMHYNKPRRQILTDMLHTEFFERILNFELKFWDESDYWLVEQFKPELNEYYEQQAAELMKQPILSNRFTQPSATAPEPLPIIYGADEVSNQVYFILFCLRQLNTPLTELARIATKYNLIAMLDERYMYGEYVKECEMVKDANEYMKLHPLFDEKDLLPETELEGVPL